MRITGDRALRQKLSPANYKRRISDGLRAAAFHIKGKASQYPPPRPRKQPPVSDKQRRFLIWAIRTGLINVPYRRTTTLGKGWDFKLNSPTQALVFNDVDYGEFVQGTPGQSKYHGGNWKTEEIIARQEEKAAAEIIEKHLNNLF